MITPVSAKVSLRVLQFIRENGSATSSPFNDGKRTRELLMAGNAKKMVCPSGVLDALHKSSLIELEKGAYYLTESAVKRLKRAKAVEQGADDGGYSAQHRQIEKQQIRVGDTVQSVNVNTNESPLHRLKTRKTNNGKPWISEAAFAAGERLRMDFTKGQLMQKVTASWEAASRL